MILTFVYIAFPRLPLVEETFLTQDQHALRIYGVVLPSSRGTLYPTLVRCLPVTWAIDARPTRAKHNKHQAFDVGGTNPILYAIEEALILRILQAMLSKLSDPRLLTARGMFIGFEVYGIKLTWSGISFPSVRDQVAPEFEISIDRYIVSPQRHNSTSAIKTISRGTQDRWWRTCFWQH